MSLADHKGTQEEAWVLKLAFSVSVVKLYGFCSSIAYIVRWHHPYIESTDFLYISRISFFMFHHFSMHLFASVMTSSPILGLEMSLPC